MTIRKVLFDAFGTLLVPTAPIHEQYAFLARAVAPSLNVTAVTLKTVFKRIFKEYDEKFPLYGKHNNMTARQWWDDVILESFARTGVPQMDLDEHRLELCQVINDHFDSGKAYFVPDDVLPLLRSLPKMSYGVVSGSHNTIIDSLASKGLVAVKSVMRKEDIWTTYDVGYTKKSNDFWREVVRRLKEQGIEASEALVIGDEVVDYDLPRRHGMKSLLLDRGSEHARPGYTDHQRGDSDRVKISSLEEATEHIVSWS